MPSDAARPGPEPSAAFEAAIIEGRLHPASFLFALTRALRGLLGPAIALTLLGGGVGRWSFTLPYLVPIVGIALLGTLLRYLSFRYHLDASELVIREGILTRKERHLPLSRIQNVDLVRGPLHRWLGVADLRIETAGGSEAEATISVLGLDAVNRLRASLRRGSSAEAPASEPVLLLHVPTWQLAALGLGSGRGPAMVLAAIGLAWELSWQFDFLDRFDFEQIAERAMGWAPSQLVDLRLALALVAVSLLTIILLALLSVAWSLIRLHDFRLERQGRELRLQYGLLTRYSATVPRHRIQSLAVSDTPFLRWLGLTRVSVESAGGDSAGSAATGKMWLAPVLPKRAVTELVEGAGIDLPFPIAADAWRPVHPKAVRRIRRRRLAGGGFLGLLATVILYQLRPAAWLLPSLATLASLGIWAWVSASVEAGRMGIGQQKGVAALRRGWWTRRVSLAAADKIQAISVLQSPFDRRHDMARLAIDTAGRGSAEHSLALSYLGLEQARLAQAELGARSADTQFRW